MATTLNGSETRAPAITRANVSRPRESVPSGWAAVPPKAVARLVQAHPALGAKLLVKLTQLLAQRLRNTSSQLVKVLQRQVA